MYSILPACAALFFLLYGIYVLFEKGVSRLTLPFFGLCLCTFFWQGMWTILFQSRDPVSAMLMIRLGYVFIVFIPACWYHFLTEILETRNRSAWVVANYFFSGFFAVSIFSGDSFIQGYYDYPWGFYPQAGWLHGLHLLQACWAVLELSYAYYGKLKSTYGQENKKLKTCIFAIFIYSGAAVDYLCNYGIEFYPPGVVFILVSLALIIHAVKRYDLLHPLILAASIVHEIRTPLTTIALLGETLNQSLPRLSALYAEAQKQPGFDVEKYGLSPRVMNALPGICRQIQAEIERSNTIIDMVLASASVDKKTPADFSEHTILQCVETALQRYPFAVAERALVRMDDACPDFTFHGSEVLLVFLLFNLFKNALWAIRSAGKGEIYITTKIENEANTLCFTDTGPGVSPENLKRIFDAFFSTRHGKGGTGMGLAFCAKVMKSFGGKISCDSVEGQYTTFSMAFPKILSEKS